eukprot:jgi/Chlat1/8419/Chrsp80S07912
MSASPPPREGSGPPARRGPPDISGTHSLLVLNITFRTTPEDLMPMFERYGKVADVFIPRDRRTGESRGFAFVRFEDEQEANRAVEKLDGTTLDGRQMSVQFAKFGRNENPASRSRYGGHDNGYRGRGGSRGGRYDDRNDRYGGGGGGYGGRPGRDDRHGGGYAVRYRPRSRSRSRSRDRDRDRRSRRDDSRSPRRHSRHEDRDRVRSRSRSPARRSDRAGGHRRSPTPQRNASSKGAASKSPSPRARSMSASPAPAPAHSASPVQE